MDVRRTGFRAVGCLMLAVGCCVGLSAATHADPLYTIVDLGPGAVTFGNGTVTSSNGQTYAFDQSTLSVISPSPASLQNFPNVVAAPVNDVNTNGNPAFAYSQSKLVAINAQGIAVGLDTYGVAGHLGETEAFATQLQSNGTWGTTIPLWSGYPTWNGYGVDIQVLGITPGGQILGTGFNLNGAVPYMYDVPEGPTKPLLYDWKSRTFTDLGSVINSDSTANHQPWMLSDIDRMSLDNQGRILMSQAAYRLGGDENGPYDSFLLIPQGVPGNELAAPEPSTWLIFAMMAGAGLVRRRSLRRSVVPPGR